MANAELTQGLTASPFIDGVIVIVLGIACAVLGTVLNIPDLTPVGIGLVGTGSGYIGGHAVAQHSQVMMARKAALNKLVVP